MRRLAEARSTSCSASMAVFRSLSDVLKSAMSAISRSSSCACSTPIAACNPGMLRCEMSVSSLGFCKVSPDTDFTVTSAPIRIGFVAVGSRRKACRAPEATSISLKLMMSLPRPVTLTSESMDLNCSSVTVNVELTTNWMPGWMLTAVKSTPPLLISIVVKPVSTLSAARTTTSRASSGKINLITSTSFKPAVLSLIVRRSGFADALSITRFTESVPEPPLPITSIDAALGAFMVKPLAPSSGSISTLICPPCGTVNDFVEIDWTMVGATTLPLLKTASSCAFRVIVMGPVAIPLSSTDSPISTTSRDRGDPQLESAGRTP